MKNHNTKTIIGYALAIALTFGYTNHVEAQSFKEKLAKKLAAKAAANKSKENKSSSSTSSSTKSKPKKSKSAKGIDYSFIDATADETGTSGTYYSNDFNTKEKRTYGLEFVKKENGEWVNKLFLYVTKDQKFNVKLQDKISKKTKCRVFAGFMGPVRYDNHRELWEIDKNVFAVIDAGGHEASKAVSIHNPGSIKIEGVFAKDEAMIEAYDLETAEAKLSVYLTNYKTGDIKKRQNKCLEFDAYKNNIGKVVFANNYGRSSFNYSKRDYPKEDPTKFAKEMHLGRVFSLRAYFKEPVSVTYPGAVINIVYEMNGKKGDRMKLRDESADWQKMIGVKEGERWLDGFCVNKAFTPWNGNGLDYAFGKCMYDNKDVLKPGAKFPLKVTMYAWKDGENIAEIASGTVQVLVKKENMEYIFNEDVGKMGIVGTIVNLVE